MKRRDFLKILGACVVAPGTAIAAVKAKPKPEIKFDIPYWCKGERRTAIIYDEFAKPKDRVYLVTFRGVPLVYEPNL